MALFKITKSEQAIWEKEEVNERKVGFFTFRYKKHWEAVKDFIMWYEDFSNIDPKYFDERAFKDEIDRNDFVFAMGEFDDGKTVSFKNRMLYKFLKFGQGAMRIYNGETMLSEDFLQFADFYKLKPEWRVWKFLKMAKFNDKGFIFFPLDPLDENTFERVCVLQNIVTNPKAGRLEGLEEIYYDEFNWFNGISDDISDRGYFKKYQYKNWPILATRFQKSGKKGFFIGNNITANVPILRFYNINSIPKESTEILADSELGPFNMYFLKVKRAFEDKKEKYKDSPFAKAISASYASGITKNTTKDERYDDIIQYIKPSLLTKISDQIIGLSIGEELFNLYILSPAHNKGKEIWYIGPYNVKKIDYALNKKGTMNGVGASVNISREIAIHLIEDTILFPDIHSYIKVKEAVETFMYY